MNNNISGLKIQMTVLIFFLFKLFSVVLSSIVSIVINPNYTLVWTHDAPKFSFRSHA